MKDCRNLKLFFVTAFLISVTATNAQTGTNVPVPKKQVTERFKVLRDEESELKRQEADNPQDLKRRLIMVTGRLQPVATARSFVGDTFGATAAFDTYLKNREIAYGKDEDADIAGDISDLKNAVAEDAINAIVEAATNRQVVILNEAHTTPMHRAFAMRLARELRRIGFEYLACETFAIGDMHPLVKGYVTPLTGYFSFEPTYANFLRDALDANWKFVAYEPTNSRVQDNQGKPASRDAKMAKNLVERIFKNDPNARVFIYVGHSHVLEMPESETDSDKSKLAAQLKRMMGIDPLTIDQNQMYEHYESELQTRIYREVLMKVEGTPVVLKTPLGRPIKLAMNPAAVDMQVIFPSYGLNSKTNRAEWMSSLAGLTPRKIPKNFLPQAGKRLIYAYRSNDPLDAMPADVIMVEAGKKVPMLMLPKGEFHYAIED
jgi:hypothetical protein